MSLLIILGKVYDFYIAIGSYSGGGGGEVRKVHIIYFLSRKGRIEHPHLIRVHHLSRNGVRLRDVKRWLSELRGKDMPEGFAWSYKRRYKAGYVWQDLLDEDLITPISDNEYVLKGSEISFITLSNDLSSYGEKEVSKPKNSHPFKVEIVDSRIPLATKAQENLIDLSTKTSFEIEELPSFGSETSTDDTTKHQEDYKFVTATKHEEMQNQKKIEINSFLETFLNKNKNDSKSKKGDNQKGSCSSKASPSSNYSFRKSSSYSGSGASHTFLNLITCGIVDTNESAVTVMNQRKNGINTMNASSKKENQEGTNIGQVVKGETLGGSERKEGSKTSYNLGSSNYSIKTFPAAYKFGNGPYCSQCGRQFNPEKLHTHMKSCRGMKALAKAAKSKS
ncbi:protein UPSTREAM OF FLC-like [Cynara cardunculus var. scolymus]|uniref:protein UPSTREAM OF FLC-like n=1 Tax=Cynara cardunculus var. scolymus TaxID=59895 RepID=UPI000D62724F|nr:protein UPSTREAM OF FLC-like [Cynara cardunculus var. scolymus]